MRLADSRLKAHLGSRYAVVGLMLAWLGLSMLILGGTAAIARPPAIPFRVSLSLAAWGLLALPLGLFLRQQKPSLAVWVVANALLALGVLTLLGFLISGK